jgi:CRISPR-associated endonuclease/helicase Cas3
MQELGFDFHNPRTYERYFQRLYQAVDTEAGKIQQLRSSLSYREVAGSFRMIEEKSVPVVVPYRGPFGDDETVGKLKAIFHHNSGTAPRWVYRRLQPYIVGVYPRQFRDYERENLLGELAPGLYEWLGNYDGLRGIDTGNRDPEELVV